MINKYTLTFIDSEIEKRYQQYMTVTVRKYLLLIVIIVSLLWNVMDFLQALIEENFTLMSLEIIISQYVSNLAIVGLLLLIYFCKPSLIKWALFLSNHVFAYTYWSEDQLYTYWQSNLCTFVLVGSQMVTLMTADCLEMIYQLTLFTAIYVTKMILENQPFTYSLIVGTIIAGIGFIVIFYKIQKSQREQYRLGFVNDQWENIFITLIQNQCLIFDYDTYTQGFNYRNQKDFKAKIFDTSQLRQFLRLVKPLGQIDNLEQYLYHKLNQDSSQKLFKETINIKIKKEQIQQINISIFQGVRAIIVLQQVESDKKIPIQDNLLMQHKVLMQQAKKYIFSSKQSQKNNFLKFKRYWIYQHCRLQLILKKLPHRNVSIVRLLKGIRYLYPEKQIKIINHKFFSRLSNNLNVLTILLIDILESVLSQKVQIEISQLQDENALIIISGYFNDKLIDLVKKISQRFREFIQQINVKQFCKNIPLLEIQIIVCNLQSDPDQESIFNEQRNDQQTIFREPFLTSHQTKHEQNLLISYMN